MNTRVENKNTILFKTLSQVFGDKMNLARIKFFGLFIFALFKIQKVRFEKLAAEFDADAKIDSLLRSIQCFMSEYLLDTDLIARFAFVLLPYKPPYMLELDRSNWKFGASDINVLVLAIVSKGLAFPILYTIMPKFGNSSTAERIELMQHYIELFGVETIDRFREGFLGR